MTDALKIVEACEAEWKT